MTELRSVNVHTEHCQLVVYVLEDPRPLVEAILLSAGAVKEPVESAPYAQYLGLWSTFEDAEDAEGVGGGDDALLCEEVLDDAVGVLGVVVGLAPYVAACKLSVECSGLVIPKHLKMGLTYSS